MEHFALAKEFPPASEADWHAIVEKALKGAPFRVLENQLYEGFATSPLYTGAATSPARHGQRGWLIVQPLAGASLADAERQLADDLANGATALSLDLANGPAIRKAAELGAVLDAGVPIFLAGGSTPADAAFLLAKADKTIVGTTGFDPITAFAVAGEVPADRKAALADTVDAALAIRERFPNVTPFLASSRAWNGAGGSVVDELGFTLAAAVAYWRALEAAGLSREDASRAIGFKLSASADLFLTIAAFRAIRLLWARAHEAAGVAPNEHILLYAKTPPRILSVYDPHVNMLRSTASVFGAAIGGASAIEVHPFDEAATEPTPLSRRIARNTGLVLQSEAWLSAVADPAAGSSYVETLTENLAASAWALFREVEARGGLLKALENGFVSARLQETADKRDRAIAHRKEKITGVSVFPNLNEKIAFEEPASIIAEEAHPTVDFALPAPGAGERFAALVAAAARGVPLPELRSASRVVCDLIATGPLDVARRDAEPFEVLRQRADFALASIGSRPPLFLALLGSPSDYRARSLWVQSFFAAGGIETIVPEEGFTDVEKLAAAFKQSPAPIACLCSSNATYAELKGAAAALKRAGASHVSLAGPAALLSTLDPHDRTAVDRLVYEGCNALAILEEAQRILRVEELAEAAGLEAEDENFGAFDEA
ncbi:methylmalonyl-CoA mutase family protein [Rhodomicrobium lacus]|uniref:methylmalonyl-CoA mutase family protein n=1 Tax=Rhodomicrobium lacus TaxID=2498452 RepID=UPI0026E37A92|nr:methylmalonyl-CoA mutase family protein [Rhodomicrobium lacus]WKW49424.1 methylmalonyl-CoA mutase family protein [Rhodomicrobium lacus]